MIKRLLLRQWENRIRNYRISQNFIVDSVEEVVRKFRLKSFGHIQLMSDSLLLKKLLNAFVGGIKGWGCPRRNFLGPLKSLRGVDLNWETQDLETE